MEEPTPGNPKADLRLTKAKVEYKSEPKALEVAQLIIEIARARAFEL